MGGQATAEALLYLAKIGNGALFVELIGGAFAIGVLVLLLEFLKRPLKKGDNDG